MKRAGCKPATTEKGETVAAESQGIDPIHQFNINRLLDLRLGGVDASFTNASLFMLVVFLAITALMVLSTSGRHVVPTRLQAAAEMAYEFVASTVRDTTGDAGMRFFPFVFSLFMFVLFSNLIGLIPGAYTVTSQIIVTFAFAALVIGVVLVYGFYKHGAHFLHLFVPSGVSPALLPFIVLIEIISFVSRPISLSVRLFANMLAGHIVIFALLGLVVIFGWAALPAMALAMGVYFLELFIAFLQAYIFTLLSAMFIGQMVHPEH